MLSCMGRSFGYSPVWGNLLCSFVAPCVGEGLKRGQYCCWLTSGGLPGTHFISSHFTHFSYVTGVPPAAVLVVVPRVGGFAYALGSPEKLAVFSATPIPARFIARSYEALFFPVLEPWAARSGLGLGFLADKVSPWFFSTMRECDTPIRWLL